MEKCRKAGDIDYLAYYGAVVGDKILENTLKTEEQKPYDRRNNLGIIIGELFRIGFFSLVKYEVNKNLCNPIGNS